MSLATTNGQALTNSTWSNEQWTLIKSTIAPGCTDAELQLFAHHCQRTRLDPFSRQIYAIKRGSKMVVQVSIDGLRSIAERSGELDGTQKFWCGMDGDWKDVWLNKTPPAAAKCVLYRRGCSHPFVGIALLSDYGSNGNSLWNKMPSVMLGKVAEAQALRCGFPADLSGLYSSEEMDQADVSPAAPPKPVTVKAVQEAAAPPAPPAPPAPEPAPAKPAAEPVATKPVTPAPAPQTAPAAAPEPAAPAVAAELSAADKLSATVQQKLTATGRRALLKAYEPILGHIADVEQLLEVIAPQADVHLRGLSSKAIEALNNGLHPTDGRVLVNKPGRRPAGAAEPTVGNDPEQPFN